MPGLPQGLTTRPWLSDRLDAEPAEHGRLGPAPGTVILVFIFLAAFVVYYFVNWKMLSFVWKIG